MWRLPALCKIEKEKTMIIQIYGIRTVEDARMVVELGATNIGVSYGKIKRTPG